jgi:hypothetical protein
MGGRSSGSKDSAREKATPIRSRNRDMEDEDAAPVGGLPPTGPLIEIRAIA